MDKSRTEGYVIPIETMYTIARIYDVANSWLRREPTWAERERREVRRRSLRGRLWAARYWLSLHRPYVHIGPCDHGDCE